MTKNVEESYHGLFKTLFRNIYREIEEKQFETVAKMVHRPVKI
jgi:hypothetical protein